MGSLDDEVGRRFGNEGPVYQVRITKPFYMGKYEVTQEQWERVMRDIPADPTAVVKDFIGGKTRPFDPARPSRSRGPKNPVETISWDDTQIFLKKLNEMFKGKEEFRLPTEAQWEYACRAGTRTRFYWGDSEIEFPKYGWCSLGEDLKETHPVGQLKPNAWGLYDMLGNVWEFCQDFHSMSAYEKTTEPVSDPTGPARGGGHVMRGGPFCWPPRCCRSAYRHLHGDTTMETIRNLRDAGSGGDWRHRLIRRRAIEPHRAPARHGARRSTGVKVLTSVFMQAVSGTCCLPRSNKAPRPPDEPGIREGQTSEPCEDKSHALHLGGPSV